MNTENNTPVSSNDNDNKPKWFTRKVYETDAEKKRDFWIGVVLFFVLNIVLILCQWGLGIGFIAAVPDTGIGETANVLVPLLSIVITFAPWVINGGLVIYFALTRSQIALGMVRGSASCSPSSCALG